MYIRYLYATTLWSKPAKQWNHPIGSLMLKDLPKACLHCLYLATIFASLQGRTAKDPLLVSSRNQGHRCHLQLRFGSQFLDVTSPWQYDKSKIDVPGGPPDGGRLVMVEAAVGQGKTRIHNR